MALCNLSDVKTLLNIEQSDTSYDAKLNLLIEQASAKIEGFLGYKLQRGEYTEELHSVNFRQLLPLNHFPIQSVSSVTVNEEEITDYKIIPNYSRWGNLYRGCGWSGNAYVRGFTHDIVAGAWDIKVSYIAGYYLPSDTGYEQGADDSLPSDIMAVCLDLVVERFSLEEMGAIGLKAHHEGNISDTFSDSSCSAGLSESAKSLLAKYSLYGVA